MLCLSLQESLRKGSNQDKEILYIVEIPELAIFLTISCIWGIISCSANSAPRFQTPINK